MRAGLGIVALAVLMLGSTTAVASLPDAMNVDGMLLTGSGVAANGDFDLVLSVWDAQTGGTGPIQTWTLPATSVDEGTFSVTLTNVQPGLFAAADALWLQAQVQGEPPMPRQPLLPAPWAFRAERADEAGGLSCSQCITSAQLGTGAVKETHVGFSYAAGAGKGGDATGLACTSACVSALELEAGSVGPNQLQAKAVKAGNVDFNYAGSGAPDGPANDVFCVSCVDGGEIVTDPELIGDASATGSIAACTGGDAGCAVSVGSVAMLVPQSDGFLSVRATSGLRVRTPNDAAWAPLQAGALTVAGGLTLSGALSVAQGGTITGDLGVGTASPLAKLDVNGTVRIGGAGASCTAQVEGALKYEGNKFYGCDGTEWVLLNGGGASSGDGSSQSNAGASCKAILVGKPALFGSDGVYWINPLGGASTNAFQVYCDMTLDGGGWTLVWKHSYYEVGTVNDNMRTFSAYHQPCTSLGTGWCNVPNKGAIGKTDQMIESRHYGQVIYAYKGDLNSNLDSSWNGTILNNFTKLVDKCNVGNGVYRPEPEVGAHAYPGLTFDKWSNGDYTSNCDTDRYGNGGDCRWENCQLPSSISSSPYHVQMSLFLFVR